MSAIKPGAKAPEFKLKGARGEQVSLSGASGEPTVVTFLKSTCPYCQQEAPKLAEAFAKHKGDAIAVLGITSGNDTEKDISDFAKRHHLDFAWGMDPGRRVRDAYGATIVPTLVFVGKDGNVAKVYEGSTDRLADAVDRTIQALVSGGPLPNYAEVGSG